MKQIIFLILLMVTLNSCLKKEPNAANFKAQGAWLVKNIKKEIYTNFKLSNVETYKNCATMRLIFNDNFFNFGEMGVGTLPNFPTASEISKLIRGGWNMGVDCKVFYFGAPNNLAGMDFSGKVSVVKFRNGTMVWRFFEVDNNTGKIKYVETWEMKRGTHF